MLGDDVPHVITICWGLAELRPWKGSMRNDNSALLRPSARLSRCSETMYPEYSMALEDSSKQPFGLTLSHGGQTIRPNR